jgi:SHAQKYF class myb-like DNA-binding protein
VNSEVTTSSMTNMKKWSESEHRRFLLGLEIYGKGHWSKIAKKFVLTRNYTQVASHAQKYFKRLEPSKTKRRRSIFDTQLAPSEQKYFKRPEPSKTKRRPSIFDTQLAPSEQKCFKSPTICRPKPRYPVKDDWYMKLLSQTCIAN